MKVKKGDEVVVIAGKDKGTKGTVIAAYPESDRVIVEGVNRVTKHTRVTQTARGAKAGGIEHTEAPIHVSNVMVLDDGGQRTRVGYRRQEESEVDEGKKARRVRVAKSTGKDL
jgi:large subunit ribosomal protein L24